MWSVRFGVWRKQWEVRSVKCGLWSVKCGVWSLKFGVRRVQCEVWSVKTLLRLSLKKKAAFRGKDTVGTGCFRTIGHLFLGNFRRRLARVLVLLIIYIYSYPQSSFQKYVASLWEVAFKTHSSPSERVWLSMVWFTVSCCTKGNPFIYITIPLKRVMCL